MDSSSNRESRVLWSFWVACGLAATGAIAQIVLAAGDVSRAVGVAIPFAIAAIVMGAIAFTYPRGKSFTTALYILAWIAIVYAILRMISVPLQEVAIGACPVSAGACAPGFSQPFGPSETIAIVVGIVTGAISLQVGYFGLRAIYRSARREGPASYASVPPTRVIPPARSTTSAPPPRPEPAATSQSSVAEPATDPAPAPKPARQPRAPRTKKPAVPPASAAEQAELPAHSEPAELPAPSEPAELPAPSEPAELPPHSGTS